MGIRLDGLVALVAGLNGVVYFAVVAIILAGLRLAARDRAPGLAIHVVAVAAGGLGSAVGLAIDAFAGAKAALDFAVPVGLAVVVGLWLLITWVRGTVREASVIGGVLVAHVLVVVAFVAAT